MSWKLPFGMSNVSNPNPNPPANTPNQQQQGNPNFPSSTQLQQKNNTTDPANIAGQHANQNEPNNDPNANADPNKGNKGSQLDAYKDWFKMPTDKDGNPTLPTDPLATPVMQIDPKKIGEAVQKMDFSRAIDPELATKALAGDSQAFGQVINAAIQGAVGATVQISAGMMQTALTKQVAQLEAALPERIRQTQISQAQPKNPVLSHPAIAPMVAAAKQQFAIANPHLTPDQITTHVENMFVAMRSDMNSLDEQAQAANKPKDPTQVDWMATLTNG